MTEKPVGTWLCFTCSPNAAFYAKQLATNPSASSLVPTLKKGATPSSIKPMAKVPKAATPGSSKGKEPIARSGPATAPDSMKEYKQVPVTRRNSTAKKGVAVRRPVPDSPKPKWKGWQSMASDEEEDFKKNVDAQWAEDGVDGKRRRSSKAVSEEIESGPRRLRTRSIPDSSVTQKTSSDSSSSSSADSKESIYQDEENENENEEEEEEEPTSEDSSDREMLPDASEEHKGWGDNMDVDDANDHADKDSSDEPFEGFSNVDGETAVSPSQIPPATPMETEFDHNDGVEPSGSDHSDSSRNSSPSPPTTPPRVFYARKRGQPVSLSPDSTPRASPAASPAASHISVSSSLDQVSISDGDGMDIDNDDDSPDVQILEGSQAPVAVTPAVESDDIATRYQRQGNRWGEAPESAVRSTLPRLG